MVGPITGPFTKAVTTLGPPNYYGFRPVWKSLSRSWYRQRRPYDSPLDFTFQQQQVLSFSAWDPIFYTSTHDCAALPSATPGGYFPATYNRAYDKFVSQLKPDTAGLGIGLVQRKQAMDMISNRTFQLLAFAVALRKGYIREAAKRIGVSKDPRSKKIEKKFRRGAKSFADTFLEFHFGWGPLIGDIGSAVDILQQGVPPVRVKASATGTDQSRSSYTYSDQKFNRSATITCTWSIRADAVVTNPNLWLANQLGFVNPALIVYDAVPFSFVLNWFINVESFLSSFSDFWGITLKNASVTSHTVINSQVQTTWLSLGAANIGQYQTVETRRKAYGASIPGPTLRPRDPWVLSPTRALTAISLLLQKLKG